MGLGKEGIWSCKTDFVLMGLPISPSDNRCSILTVLYGFQNLF
jgi:hypothetical protein